MNHIKNTFHPQNKLGSCIYKPSLSNKAFIIKKVFFVHLIAKWGLFLLGAEKEKMLNGFELILTGFDGTFQFDMLFKLNWLSPKK